MVSLEDINLFIDGFYKPLDNEMVQLRQGEKEYVPYIRKQTESFIGVVLQLLKPKKILELGTAIGYSAIYMAKKSTETIIYTIERDEAAAKEAEDNIEKAGLSDRIHVLKGECLNMLEELDERDIRDFDILFIDAAKSHYREFLDMGLRLLKEGALVLSDDVLQRGITLKDEEDPEGKHRTSSRNMREYLKYISEDQRFETAILNIGDGLAMTVYKGKNE